MRSSAACDQERSDKRPDDLPSELVIATRPPENWGSLRFGVFQQNRRWVQLIDATPSDLICD